MQDVFVTVVSTRSWRRESYGVGLAPAHQRLQGSKLTGESKPFGITSRVRWYLSKSTVDGSSSHRFFKRWRPATWCEIEAIVVTDDRASLHSITQRVLDYWFTYVGSVVRAHESSLRGKLFWVSLGKKHNRTEDSEVTKSDVYQLKSRREVAKSVVRSRAWMIQISVSLAK